MTSWECYEKKWFYMKYIGKMAETESLLSGDTKQSRLESTTEITQNKHVKVLHYFVDDIKWLKWYL
jgi:hypothetical protein